MISFPRLRFAVPVAAILVSALPATAQDEAALRSFFEGKRVTLKMDMPATSDGVDLRIGDTRPLDYKTYGDRLKANGTSIRNGESATVTLVKVKKNTIEVQLSGGGFGTAGDNSSTSLPVSTPSKTKREQELEKTVKTEPDAAKKKSMERELSDLRDDRNLETAKLTVARAQAETAMRMRVAEQRLQGGSRFNLRYSRTPGDITPQALMATLSDYIEFFPTGPNLASATLPVVVGQIPTPFKGMLRAMAEQSFGRPVETGSRREGVLTVNTLVFIYGEQRISAEFVEDVLIRYSVTSR